MKYVGCVMANHHGGHSLSFCLSILSLPQWILDNFSRKKEKCTALCQLTTLQTGADHAWQTRLIKQEGQRRKLMNKRPVRLHGSHITINKCAKRQLFKWALLAALLVQFAASWKIFCAQHGCTWITNSVVQYCTGSVLFCFPTMLYNGWHTVLINEKFLSKAVRI